MTPSVVSIALAQRQLVWHAEGGRAGPRRGAFIPFGVRAAATSAILFLKRKTEIYYRIVYFYCFKCPIILFMKLHVDCVKIMSRALSEAELVPQFYYIIL